MREEVGWDGGILSKWPAEFWQIWQKKIWWMHKWCFIMQGINFTFWWILTEKFISYKWFRQKIYGWWCIVRFIILWHISFPVRQVQCWQRVRRGGIIMEMRRTPIKPTIVVSFYLVFSCFIFFILCFIFCISYFVSYQSIGHGEFCQVLCISSSIVLSLLISYPLLMKKANTGRWRMDGFFIFQSFLDTILLISPSCFLETNY